MPSPPRQVLATTDVCLRVVSKDLLPLNPTLLVSYDLPARKVTMGRGAQALQGCAGVVRSAKAPVCSRMSKCFDPPTSP